MARDLVGTDVEGLCKLCMGTESSIVNLRVGMKDELTVHELLLYYGLFMVIPHPHVDTIMCLSNELLR